MNVRIEISKKTLQRLQKFAIPLIDTPDSIINKLIDEIEKNLLLPKNQVRTLSIIDIEEKLLLHHVLIGLTQYLN